MARRASVVLAFGLLFAMSGTLFAQQQKPEDIPDAPSAARPIPPPSAREEAQGEPDSPDSKAASDQNGGTKPAAPMELPRSNPNSDAPSNAATPPPPMPPVRTVPAGSVPKDLESGTDLYTIRRTSTLVLVPVTVKDNSGRLVAGLLPKDFSVLESGQKQALKFFTSDPFPLSAAVIFDTGMPDVGLHKVQETLSALQGAFSQFDEVGIYTYSSTVSQVGDFDAAGKQMAVALNQVKGYSGTNNGPPVTSGPLGPQGPMINGLPVGAPPVTPVSTPPKTSRVLNDAVLMAARDLSKRDRARRKIIFVISDGREQGSTASYSDTLKVLLTQNITVYAIGVEGAAIPIYDRLQRVHLPKSTKLLGYSDILPKYVSATGGGTMYSEMAQSGIEAAYAKAIGDARNQYTIGYTPKAGIGGYRQIEVRVRRQDVKVYARDGYYPLPAAR